MTEQNESKAQENLQTDGDSKKTVKIFPKKDTSPKKEASKKDNTASQQKEKTDYHELYAQLQSKYDALEDKYLRAEAEMANMNTRFKKEQERLLKYDGQGLAKEVLPVIDNLDRALKFEVTDDASKQLKHGIELVYQDMEKALTANHVTKIKALGQEFDPVIHQAVKTVPVEDGQKAETVVEVFQDGYMLKDRVLRPAMVVVAQ
ncbi:nucleotide exchange factor GrpE [Liquorilactobacillus oeni]|uniref:Protein GrpE n=1 Tax=Liquorilactobacillus oeni DSM 19972 TaxID=1423777 RepID=A0A0R1M846_9LACO|nr:nucleotide exchange factor GrpE [Liquorilactobacillus oeni]KRL04284.1 GrpE protein [Liquorilactobacillus oeni DSM 19972]